MMHLEGKKMIKYLKIYKEFFKNDLIRSLYFKESFILSLCEGMSMFFINIVFYSSIYNQTNNIADWSKYETMMLIGTYQLIIGLFYGLFINNLPGFASYVRKGDLDFMLIKPVSCQFYISTRYVSIGHIISSLSAIPLLIISINKLNILINLFQCISYLILICLSIITLYSILLIFMSLSIWLIKINGIYILMMDLLSYASYPSTIFKGIIRVLFLTIIPIIVICNVPVDILFNGFSFYNFIYCILIATFFFFLSKKFFKYSLNFYSSASS